jgi:hypothetical protein
MSTLDTWFPELGPCGICGSGLDQRHRVLDAIYDRVAAGETPDEVAADYHVPVEAVETIMADWNVETGQPRDFGPVPQSAPPVA